MVCRFGYLQPEMQAPAIDKNQKDQWTFFPARAAGDRDINKYTPILLAMWRANVDMGPILSEQALTQYIGKYTTKSEGSSESLLEEMRLLATRQENDYDGIDHLVAQMMNKFCVERDFSAQEASHQLLSLQMVECSRVFETISLVHELCVSQVINTHDGMDRRWQRGEGDGSSKLEKYMQRPPEMAEHSYFNTIKKYTYNKNKKTFVPRKQDAVVIVYPYNWQKGLPN
jgi:hypothetical protein